MDLELPAGGIVLHHHFLTYFLGSFLALVCFGLSIYMFRKKQKFKGWAGAVIGCLSLFMTVFSYSETITLGPQGMVYQSYFFRQEIVFREAESVRVFWRRRTLVWQVKHPGGRVDELRGELLSMRRREVLGYLAAHGVQVTED